LLGTRLAKHLARIAYLAFKLDRKTPPSPAAIIYKIALLYSEVTTARIDSRLPVIRCGNTDIQNWGGLNLPVRAFRSTKSQFTGKKAVNIQLCLKIYWH